MKASIAQEVEKRTAEYTTAGRDLELREAELKNEEKGLEQQLQARIAAQGTDRQVYEQN